jgi:ribosomal protein S18 acetylase RimI-like enzyme
MLKFTENNQIIGCVLLVEKEQELYLGMLTVSPELQNSGLGKKLLQQAEVHAQVGPAQNYNDGYLSREELIAWYKRHGYIDNGEKNLFSKRYSYFNRKQPLEFIVLEKKWPNFQGEKCFPPC